MPRQPDRAPLVARFDVAETALIGEGGESRVYALDEHRVLRLSTGTVPDRIARRAALTEEISMAGLAFAVPHTIEWGESDGLCFSVESRLPGRSLTDALSRLAGAERRRALASYVDAVMALRTVPFPRTYFGEVLAEAPFRRSRWPAFLVDRSSAVLAGSRGDLVNEAPAVDLERLVASFTDRAERLAEIDTPALVHGDFFPGNVLIGADSTVSAVIDFSDLTLAGDPRLDAVGALVFLGVHDGATAADRALVRSELDSRDPGFEPVAELYHLYYALRFSFTRSLSPRLFAWCVSGLRALARRD